MKAEKIVFIRPRDVLHQGRIHRHELDIKHVRQRLGLLRRIETMNHHNNSRSTPRTSQRPHEDIKQSHIKFARKIRLKTEQGSLAIVELALVERWQCFAGVTKFSLEDVQSSS